MNERIYELALQAEMAANKGDSVDVKIMMAKFGALIIKECIDIVGVGGEFASRPKLVEKLQEHFGVEE